MERTEGICQREGDSDRGGHPYLCGHGQCGHMGASGTVPAGREQCAHGGGRLPAGRFFGGWAVMGKSAVPLGIP